MAVMARERWTDERIDEAFGRIDDEIRELRVEMRRGFEQIDKRFEQIDKRFERVDDRFESMHSDMNTRFDSLQKTMFIGFVTLFSSTAASLIGAIFAA
jgi:archaellum component FlaC